MYFKCNPDVLSMYFGGIGFELTEKFDVLVEYWGCIDLFNFIMPRVKPRVTGRVKRWVLRRRSGEVPDMMY